MFGAGCPFQPWSTRKLASRGGHALAVGKPVRPRPRVATQTRIPFRESFLKLLKRVTGWTAPASCTVTATTSDGLSAPARWTSQPDVGRKLASGECTADPPLV